MANHDEPIKKIKYHILRRHLAFLYEKGEDEAKKTVLDIISKLQAGDNELTLEYCNGMEITYDSTVSLIFEEIPGVFEDIVSPALTKLDESEFGKKIQASRDEEKVKYLARIQGRR